MKFADFKIGTRLGAAFALVLVLFAATAGVAVTRLSASNDNIDDLANQRMVRIDQASDIKDNANVIARSVRNAVLTNEPAEIAAEIKRIGDTRAANTEIIKKLEEGTNSEAGKALMKAFAEARGPYTVAVDKVTALALDNKDDEARKLMVTELRKAQGEFFKAIDGVAEFQKTAAKKAADQAAADYAQSRTLLISLAAAAIAVSIALARGYLPPHAWPPPWPRPPAA